MTAVVDVTDKNGVVVEQVKLTGVEVVVSTYSVDTSTKKPTESVTLSFSQATVLKKLSTKG